MALGVVRGGGRGHRHPNQRLGQSVSRCHQRYVDVSNFSSLGYVPSVPPAVLGYVTVISVIDLAQSVKSRYFAFWSRVTQQLVIANVFITCSDNSKTL